MGEVTGFLQWERRTREPAAGACATARLARGVRGVPRRRGAPPGGTLHGLWDPVLQRRLPAGQPDPRLERPRVPGSLARRHRPSARHEQLPRVHRPAVPGAVRGGVRAGDQRRPGDDQAGRGGHHRSSVGRGLGNPADRVDTHRQTSDRDRQWPRRTRRGPTAHPCRPRRRRTRTSRPHRRVAPLRDPRVQDGKAAPRPPPRPDGGGGHRVPHERSRRRDDRHRRVAGDERCSRAGLRRDCLARPAGPRARARRHLPGDGVPASIQPRAAR